MGHGGLKEGQVVNKLRDTYERVRQQKMTDEDLLEATKKNNDKLPIATGGKRSGIVVRGASDVSVRYSKCCNPIPGDEIVGYITRGRGISIHRTDCVNIVNMSAEDRARVIEAEWQGADNEEDRKTYEVDILVYAKNRKALIIDISHVLVENGLDIGTLNARVNKQGVATIEIMFYMHNKTELNMIISKLKNIESVIDIERKSG